MEAVSPDEMEKAPLLNRDKKNLMDESEATTKLSRDISKIQHIKVQVKQVQDMIENNVKKVENVRASLLGELEVTSKKLEVVCGTFDKVTKDLKDKHKASNPKIILGCICGALLVCVAILVYIEMQRETK